MNYPFDKNKKGHPVLDTEEKLQWYMNRLLHREVDLYYVNAEAHDLESVWLRKRRCDGISMYFSISAVPTLIEPDHYGHVDRSVVPVLRAIHARRDAEMEQRRREAAIEAMSTEKEIKAAYKRWWKSLFKNGKEEE